MSGVAPLAEHLAPDCIYRLERAAEARFQDAQHLADAKRPLASLYFFGYSVEMCLAAAYYRSAGFAANVPIDRDTRQRRMAQARLLRTPAGEPLMNSDPHPLVGWARFLEWQRKLTGPLSKQDTHLLQEAIRKAQVVYQHWRPELRYKTTDVTKKQLEAVHRAASWFIEQRGRL